jgi:branched-chain amino acid transport system permease protein
VIGGLGSEVGALLGAAFLAAAPEVLRQFKDAEMVVYGAILVLCMLFLPGGLAGIGRRWISSR